MRLEGLSFVFDEFNRLVAGVCACCGAELPPLGSPQRTREFTCDDTCHRAWIHHLVEKFGETRVVIDATTGKHYAVPTRVILDEGITLEKVRTFPEVRPT